MNNAIETKCEQCGINLKILYGDSCKCICGYKTYLTIPTFSQITVGFISELTENEKSLPIMPSIKISTRNVS